MRDWFRDSDSASEILAVFSGVIAGLLVWRAYQLGMSTGAYRELRSLSARVASEALGG